MQVVKTGKLTVFYEYLNSPPAKSGKRRNMIGHPRLVREYPYGRKKWECLYRIPAVPLYDEETVLEFMMPRLEILTAAFKVGRMPPVADDDVRTWKCSDYCNVRRLCEIEEERDGRQLIIPQ
jgi:hypothetical protein